jgi:hypothetical protein
MNKAHPNPTPEELKHSKRWFKSATPKYTTDWYIKWVASFFLLAAMSMRGVEGLQFYDLSLSIVGVTGWLVVSAIWEDRALIILNSFGLLLLLKTLIVGLLA